MAQHFAALHMVSLASLNASETHHPCGVNIIDSQEITFWFRVRFNPGNWQYFK